MNLALLSIDSRAGVRRFRHSKLEVKDECETGVLGDTENWKLEVKSAVAEEASDIAAATGHGGQTMPNPASKLKLTVSTGVVSGGSGDSGDHSGYWNLKQRLDMCEASCHTEKEELMNELARWRSKAEATHTVTSSEDVGAGQVMPEPFGYLAHTMFTWMISNSFIPHLDEMQLQDDGSCSAQRSDIVTGFCPECACPLFTALYRKEREPPLTSEERLRRASTAAQKLSAEGRESVLGRKGLCSSASNSLIPNFPGLPPRRSRQEKS